MRTSVSAAHHFSCASSIWHLATSTLYNLTTGVCRTLPIPGRDFSDKLASYVSFQGPRPKVVLLIAPCRSGTTALSRAVAYAGVTVVYQKIKEALRLVLVDELRDTLTPEEASYFHVDSTPRESLALPQGQVLFMKETMGGAHPLESFFDPMSVLLKAGWTPEDVTLVTMSREPLASFASWVKHWGERSENGHGGASLEQLLTNYRLAMASVAHNRRVAADAGVRVVSLDYEAFSRGPPATVMTALLSELGLADASARSVNATQSWELQPEFLTSDGGRMHMPRGASHTEYLRHVHSDLLASPGLFYRRKTNEELLSVVPSTVAAFLTEAVAPTYHAVQMDCMAMVARFNAQTAAVAAGTTPIATRDVPRPAVAKGTKRTPAWTYGASSGAAILLAFLLTRRDTALRRPVGCRKGCGGRLAQSGPARRQLLSGSMRAALAMLCTLLGLNLCITTLCLQGRVVDVVRGSAAYLSFLSRQNEAFRAADLYVQHADLPTLAWQTATCWARAPPDIQIIGAQKAGTSSLHAMLLQHPDVVGGVSKESHFTDGRSIFGTSLFSDKVASRWAYSSFFPSFVARTAHWLKRGGHPLRVVDATPVNLLLPHAARLLHDVNPDAKLLVVLRHPVQRLWSHYRHNVRWGRESRSLRDAVCGEACVWAHTQQSGEAAEMCGCSRTCPAARHNGTTAAGVPDEDMLNWSYIHRSQYAVQLARWTEVFPRHQLKIIHFDELTRFPSATMAEVFDFLGLASDVAVTPVVANSGTLATGRRSALTAEELAWLSARHCLNVRAQAHELEHVFNMTGMSQKWL